MLVTHVALTGSADVDEVTAFYTERLGFSATGGMSIAGAELARLQGHDVEAMQTAASQRNSTRTEPMAFLPCASGSSDTESSRASPAKAPNPPTSSENTGG
jgi:hypothetical protein